MTVGNRRWVLVSGLALLLACSGGGGADRKLRVGQEPDPEGGGSAGFSSGSGQVGDGGVASGGNALRVHVEDIDEMTIEVITIACAGDCADVVAVASGGNAPYAFAWEDGSTSAKRRVCLDASAKLTVSATDTAIETDEFEYEAQTASADVTATVLDCTGDASVPDGDTLCLQNPSFEGTPGAFGTAADAFDATPWNGCAHSNPDFNPSTPDVVDERTIIPLPTAAALLPPTDGATYLHVGWDPPLHEYVSQSLCTPLRAGRSYSFTVDLATQGGLGPAQLAVYGSANECSRDELLWTSPVAPTSGWTTYCATLTPTHDVEHITFEPTGPEAKTSYLLVDNVVPVTRCP